MQVIGYWFVISTCYSLKAKWGILHDIFYDPASGSHQQNMAKSVILEV